MNSIDPAFGNFGDDFGIAGWIGRDTERVVLYFTKIEDSGTVAKTMTYNGHRYERYDYHLTWTEAKAFCESKGGHLVSITSEEEQAKVEELLGYCPFGVYYIGGIDANESGNWSWVSGESFASYQNWDTDYPEGMHQDPGEPYSAIIGNENPPNKQVGEWVDCPNEKTGGFYGKQNCGFICEYENFYTVSYDANGGSDAPASQLKAEGVSLTLTTACPTNTILYNFMGWATDPSATVPEYYGGETYAVDADMTLYAVWERNCMLSFDANGGTGGPAPGLVRPNCSAYIDQDIPVYDGYRFLGWATGSTATEAEYQPGDQITITQDTVLYAVWKKVLSSDWRDTRPAGVADDLTETITQYRSSSKETTSSTESTLDSWTLTGSQQVWGDYGNWSEWSTNAVSKSDSRDVQTTAMYRYYYYLCPSCGRHEPFTGTSDCGNYTLSGSNWVEKWFPTPYSQSNSQTFSYSSEKRYTTSLGDNQTWCFSSGNLNDMAVGTKDKGGSSDVVITTGYRYRDRTSATEYLFERWSDWSDWSDTPVAESDSVRVETRTLYRCVVDGDRVMTLPGGVTEIGSEAFQGIGGDAVIIPNGVTSIADDAFDPGMIIIGETGSEAENYAARNARVFIPLDE